MHEPSSETRDFRALRRPYEPPATPRPRNIVFLTRPGAQGANDARLIAEELAKIAPEARLLSCRDRPYPGVTLRAATRPCMTFSPSPAKHFRPIRGPRLSGVDLGKHEENLRLRAAGLPVPEWRLVTKEHAPDMSGFADYVVMKPDRGGRGADVRIVKTSKVKWRETKSDYIHWDTDWIAQEFIRTGPYPVSFRVTTFFGETLFARRAAASETGQALHSLDDLGKGGAKVTSNQASGSMSLTEEAEIIDLAERAHMDAFPDIPALGVDIIRDADTGALYICEVNAIGFIWHMSSDIGRKEQAANGLDFAAQFGAWRKVAETLARESLIRAR